MKSRRRVFLATVFLVSGLGAGCTDAGSASLDIKSQRLVGDELRLIVETSRSWRPLLSHSSRISDSKGYYVAIDLASKKPLPERTRIVGPLWDDSNPRAGIGFRAGVNLTEVNVDAEGVNPYFVLDADQALLRFTPDAKRKAMVRDALVTIKDGASWKRLDDARTVFHEWRFWGEDRVATGSDRFAVFTSRDGKAECINLATGERIDDDWLTRSFAEVRKIRNFENVNYFLTEDLNFLVVSPQPIWNDGKGTIYKTFDYDGVTHQRGKVGLIYGRPKEKPELFARRSRGQIGDPPHGAFSIEGRLHLFDHDASGLRLYTADGAQEVFAPTPPGSTWDRVYRSRIQQVPAAHELVLFGSNEITPTAGPDDVVFVIRWNYDKNVVTTDAVPIIDLFGKSWGQLVPKSSLQAR